MSALGIPLFRKRSRSVLPGFRLSLGFTLFYLTGIVLIPLLALVLRPFTLGWDQLWTAISSPRVLASLRLSFGMAFAAAAIDSFFGVIIAWVLVRYQFAGKGVLDALIDLPLRAAHSRGGHRTINALRSFRLDRRHPNHLWHPRCLHALGRVGCHDIHCAAFLGTHHSAGIE